MNYTINLKNTLVQILSNNLQNNNEQKHALTFMELFAIT